VFQIPALAQILVIFVLIVVATAKKIHLGLAAAMGGFLLALWRGLSLERLVAVALGETLSADTLLLLCLMTCIMIFSVAMKKSGAMDAFAAAIVGVAPSQRSAMAIAPLLIGTLPVPGGAILSAPLVESMDSDRERSAGTLSAANYWFRHCLELVWPLYPAFILSTSLSGIPIPRLILLNLFAPPCLFILGLIFILPSKSQERKQTKKAMKLKPFLAGIAPLGIVLGCYIVLLPLWNVLAPSLGMAAKTQSLLGRYLPILLGLGLGCLYIARVRGGYRVFKGILKPSILGLLGVIVGIRIFSALLGAAKLPLAAAGDLQSLGISPLIATALIPFIAGLVTGVGFGYVGLAFPIVIGMISGDPSSPFEAGITLAGAFGYAGMMLSPLHVCMVVTAEHFHAGLAGTIRRFALPLFLFLGVSAAYVALLFALL
jgi:integral membrane protein (TIGR00529 family)